MQQSGPEWHFNFWQVIRLIWRKPIEEKVALIMIHVCIFNSQTNKKKTYRSTSQTTTNNPLEIKPRKKYANKQETSAKIVCFFFGFGRNKAKQKIYNRWFA